MKTIKGIKKAVSVLKGAQFGRIYINVNTYEVEALACISSACGRLNSDDLREVGTYNPRFDNLSMSWIKAMVEEYVYRLR